MAKTSTETSTYELLASETPTIPLAVLCLKNFGKKPVKIYRNLIEILYNFYQNLPYLSDIKIRQMEKL